MILKKKEEKSEYIIYFKISIRKLILMQGREKKHEKGTKLLCHKMEKKAEKKVLFKKEKKSYLTDFLLVTCKNDNNIAVIRKRLINNIVCHGI